MESSLPDRWLVLDCDRGAVTSGQISNRTQRQFIGGKGLGARYLYRSVPAGAAPCGPDNRLVFAVGPLTGHLPGDGRTAVITKSPLTGLFLDSYVGGSLGRSLRAYDPSIAGIVLTGVAGDLSLLDLRGEEPTLEAGGALAGEPIDTVAERFPEASVVAIGPAGEQEVAFATIGIDGGDHHAGRGGAGAVMGSKGIKAIVLPRVADLPAPTPELADLRDETRDTLASAPYGSAYRTTGTLESVEVADETGMLSSFGWRSRGFTGTDAIGIEAVQAAATGREHDDDALPGDFRVESDDGETVIRGGTPIALGANLGIDDFDAVATLGHTCDRLGLDVISAGNVVALAVRASEAGVIDREIEFERPADARSLLEEVARGDTPLGRTLARGVSEAAHEFGLEGSIPTVKAMAVPSFDPRGAPALALAYATSDRGACHRRAIPATVQVFEPGWTTTQTAEAIASEQDRRAVLWNLIADDLMAPIFSEFGAAWLAAIGHERRPRDLERVGTRTWTMTRLFNVREGVTATDDRLPAPFAHADGIEEVWFERARRRYYEIRDWDRAGRPSRRLLERLDIAGLVDSDTPVGGHPLRSDYSKG